MNKQQIAENMIRIKSLQDALKAELNQLRQHISVGEKINTVLGEVNHVASERTSYDEEGLFHELNRLGIDPNLIGEVVVKVDRKKFAQAISNGKIPSSMIEDFSETKEAHQLRIKPTQDEDLKKETMERVASIIKK